MHPASTSQDTSTTAQIREAWISKSGGDDAERAVISKVEREELKDVEPVGIGELASKSAAATLPAGEGEIKGIGIFFPFMKCIYYTSTCRHIMNLHAD